MSGILFRFPGVVYISSSRAPRSRASEDDSRSINSGFLRWMEHTRIRKEMGVVEEG